MSIPFTFSIAFCAESSCSNWTNPWPFEIPDSSKATRHERIGPNTEKVSCKDLLSISLSKFCRSRYIKNRKQTIQDMSYLYIIPEPICNFTLIKILADPFLRIVGSRWEYMMRIDFPLTAVKFSNSIARDARKFVKQNRSYIFYKNISSKRKKTAQKILYACPYYVCHLKQIRPDTSCMLPS